MRTDRPSASGLGGLITVLGLIIGTAAAHADERSVIDLSGRRELFVDEFLIDKRDGLELRLQKPVPREIVIRFDAPWEGSGTNFFTVFRDGNIMRMYYMATELTNEDATTLAFGIKPSFACYAESLDGIHWVKPELGLIEYQGSKKNNIVWGLPRLDNFTPFKDTNPDCPPDERYKALQAGVGRGLFAIKSADGIHWSALEVQPILRNGTFDSQNSAFWDPLRKHYWAFTRDFHNGVRDIRVTTSSDFRTWPEPERIQYVDSPDEPLYTNQIKPYYRAPHLFLGFPTRYVARSWSVSFDALPDPAHRKARMKFSRRFGPTVTDGQFMTSRDGRTFHRWDESFLRPGPERRHNWIYGDCYPSLGLLETVAEDPTAPHELSIYVGEDHWKHATRARRYTLRIDGFVALHARQKDGDLVTKPFTFRGKSLSLNFATSAAGHIRVEIQDAAGRPLPGFGLDDCDELFGDTLDRAVTWKGSDNVSGLAGKPIRLHVIMSDADLFSLQFVEPVRTALK